MNKDREISLGVKMLADHLVKVKMQYEEQINNMLVRLKNTEKERDEMNRLLQLKEEELDMRRREIYQMKREATGQYMMEERENWKAMLSQQKQANSKLERDLEISRERIQTLLDQIEDLTPKLVTPSTERKAYDSQQQLSEDDMINNHLSETPLVDTLGPPQPTAPPSAIEEGITDSYEQLLAQRSKQQEEIQRLRAELVLSDQDIKNEKKLNIQLTEQFVFRVDNLEHDHQERENLLLSAIESLKLKLDLELEKKWELLQEIREGEEEESEKGGLISYLWG